MTDVQGLRVPPPAPSATFEPPRPARRRRRPSAERSRWWLTPTVLICAGLLWQLVARTSGSLYFPPLSDVLGRFREDWLSGPAAQLFTTKDFRDVTLTSLRHLVPGFVLGAVLGTVIGMALGLAPRFRTTFYPMIHFLRAVPAVAMLPLFIVLLGQGDASTLWLVALSVTWPVLLNVVAGVDAVEPQMADTLRLYGATPSQRVRWLALPGATPHLFAGLRIATMVALAVMTVAELYIGDGGIGNLILVSQRQFDYVAMWTSVILLAVLGLALNGLLGLTERRVLAWHRGSRAEHS